MGSAAENHAHHGGIRTGRLGRPVPHAPRGTARWPDRPGPGPGVAAPVLQAAVRFAPGRGADRRPRAATPRDRARHPVVPCPGGCVRLHPHARGARLAWISGAPVPGRPTWEDAGPTGSTRGRSPMRRRRSRPERLRQARPRVRRAGAVCVGRWMTTPLALPRSPSRGPPVCWSGCGGSFLPNSPGHRPYRRRALCVRGVRRDGAGGTSRTPHTFRGKGPCAKADPERGRAVRGQARRRCSVRWRLARPPLPPCARAPPWKAGSSWRSSAVGRWGGRRGTARGISLLPAARGWPILRPPWWSRTAGCVARIP